MYRFFSESEERGGSFRASFRGHQRASEAASERLQLDEQSWAELEQQKAEQRAARRQREGQCLRYKMELFFPPFLQIPALVVNNAKQETHK
ncbi:uncharacterized protein ASCRUDRAFT_147611 [Ascoidea rubescens DSM 1968]|uniref:Uncharacterized protein n=1 Tax=Ascoidea rubescens DSM 1968 TaxID=1344418 RepID=A0A1D2VHX0_9ASCO|nr:hypothetical protein ASCRUDRAFT_147611 [Ascoidea rubescens DSM 1968]ODV61212.1 hypothetical protein ASCRUDRAFT_147611 [Ascoidea rubescens DSM 1968]